MARGGPVPGRRRGVGLGYFVEKSGIASWEYARVRVASDGDAIVYVGSASVGQGVETVLAQVCAETLGVPYEAVTVSHGDTDSCPRAWALSAAAPRCSAAARWPGRGSAARAPDRAGRRAPGGRPATS